MEKWTQARTVVVLVTLLAGGSCQPAVEGRRFGSCDVTRNECHIYYSVSSGYGRYCSRSSVPCPEDETETPVRSSQLRDAGAQGSGPTASAPPTPPTKAEDNRGAAALPDTQRFSAFDISCTRDSQCGPGKCLSGECYYGCQSDGQCGSGDRCGVETGTRICLPDPNPPVQCTRTAQCAEDSLCLNGSCRETCETSEECSNLLDRCASGVCQPDRRPLGQCVLNAECPGGFVCLDGSCVDACSSTPDGGVCLGPTKVPSQPAVEGPSTRPPPEPGLFPLVDAGAPAQPKPVSVPPAEPVVSEPEPVVSEPDPVVVPEEPEETADAGAAEPF